MTTATRRQPVGLYRKENVRNSALHWDGRRLAAAVRDWLGRHPEWTAHRLSLEAGLCGGYVGKVLSEAVVEVR